MDFGSSDVVFVEELGFGTQEGGDFGVELSDLLLEVFDVGVGHCEAGF